jgi:FkbM family methyltransferase
MLLNFDELLIKYCCSIKGVLHIGAHSGQEHSLYKKNNINNIIYFEPTKATFDSLQKNIGNDAILVNKALGNENKKVLINIEHANQGGSNSILKPKLHLEQYPHIVFTETEEVDMIRLDDYAFEKTNYNLINIDVQGYELEVLKGAEKTLDNIDYIICEVNRAEVYENCAMIDELYVFLSKYGFVLKEIDWAGYTWGDAFFVKDKK